ncbi:MAG: hypothetical protein DMF81_12935 [Acidobacteria bacterium]|nr:MAG: hypothetical protein DMF81_12935 [Acidobacteriota bacterium]
MLGLPKLPDMWRVLKEADLGAIRREAERPFQVLLVAEDAAEAERVGGLLSGPEGARHPWLVPSDPAEARRTAASGLIDLALVLSPSADPSPALDLAADALRAARVPVATIAHGDRGPMAAVIRPGEAARAAVAALEPSGVPAMAQAVMTAAPPGLRLALARQLVPLREPLFAELIEETARTNAMYALTTGIAEAMPLLDVPLNLADIVVLTKNQLVMSYRIALASGRKGTPRELIGEVLGVIGGGFLFRQGARQLVGLIPVAGIVPKVAVAYAGTLAIGRAVVAWAAYGQALEPGTVRRLYRQALSHGKDVARALVAQARKRAPRRRWLRRRRG